MAIPDALERLRTSARARAGLRVLAWTTIGYALESALAESALYSSFPAPGDLDDSFFMLSAADGAAGLLFTALQLAGFVTFARGAPTSAAKGLAWAAAASRSVSLIISVMFMTLPDLDLDYEDVSRIFESAQTLHRFSWIATTACAWGAVFASHRAAASRTPNWLAIAAAIASLLLLAWGYWLGPLLREEGAPRPLAPALLFTLANGVMWGAWLLSVARGMRSEDDHARIVLAWGMRAYRSAVLWRILLTLIAGGIVSVFVKFGGRESAPWMATLLVSMTAAPLLVGVAGMWEGSHRARWAMGIVVAVAVSTPFIDGGVAATTFSTRYASGPEPETVGLIGLAAQGVGTVGFWSLLYVLRCAAKGIDESGAVATIDRLYAASFAAGIGLVFIALLAATSPPMLLLLGMVMLVLAIWILVAFVSVLRRIADVLEQADQVPTAPGPLSQRSMRPASSTSAES